MGISLGSATLFLNADASKLNKALGKAQRAARKKFGNILNMSKKVGIGMTAVGVGIATMFIPVIKRTADFEQAVTNAAAVTGKVGPAFDETKKKIRDLALAIGSSTVFSATEAANALESLAQRGIDVASMSRDTLLPIFNLSSAIGSDLVTGSNIAIGTMQGMGFEFSDLTHIADVFAKSTTTSNVNTERLSVSMPIMGNMAKQAGISLEEAVGALGILSDTTIDASTAATGLRNVFSELLQPSTALQKKYNELGITVEDVDTKTNDLAEILENLKEKGFTAGDAMQTLGKRAGPIINILLDNTKKANSLTRGLRHVGNAAQTIADQKLDSLQGSLKLLGSAFEAVVIPIGEALNPAIRALADVLAPLAQKLADWIDQNPELTATIVGVTAGIGVLMLVLGPLIIIISSVITAVVGLVTLFGGPVVAAVAGVAAVVAAVGAGLAALAALIISNWEPIKGFFANLWDGITDIISGAWNGIKGIFQSMWDWIKKLLGGLGSVFGFGGGGGVPGFAGGGTIRSPLAIVGERGPELVSLPRGSQIHSAQDTRSALGSNVTVQINNPIVRNDQDIRAIAEQVKRVFTDDLKGKMVGRGMRPILGT